MIQPSIYEVYNGGLVCPAMSGRRGKVHLHTSRQRPPLRRCAGRCRCWSGGRQGRSRPTLLLLAPVAVASLADCGLCWPISWMDDVRAMAFCSSASTPVSTNY